MSSVIVQDGTGQLWQISVDSSGQLTTTAVTGGTPGASGTTFVGTYKVQDGLTLAQKLAKGVPFTNIDNTICDIVSATMYKFYPWRDTLAVIPAGTYPLVDGQQDYSLGAITMMRPTQFWLVRTDTSPNEVININVAKNLTIDLIPKSPLAVRSASLQAGILKLRLESAVQIPSGTSWELQGEYQPHPTKISDLQDGFWFADEYLEVFAKGLVYWAYRLADDSRMGSMQSQDGRAVYTGALAEFMQAIQDMAAAEDFGNIDPYYPGEPIATVDARRYYGADVFPFL